MDTDLAVIILNYRTFDLTVACLASLEREIEPDVRVVVVDNASGDGSGERLAHAVQERGWPWARVLLSEVNGGFAAGNNLGIRSIEARSYLLLNSDTIVRPGALRSIREALRARPEVGIIGSGLLSQDGELTYSFFRPASPVSELVRGANTGPVTRILRRFDPILPLTNHPTEAGWVSFASVLIRREVFQAIGLLDDQFFMYFEDVDFCRRARKAGWAILYWPDAKVVHLVGASSLVRDGDGRLPRAPRYYYEARARYFAKYYGRAGLWLANLLWYVGRGISAGRELLGRPPRHREREGLDIWTNALAPQRPRLRPLP